MWGVYHAVVFLEVHSFSMHSLSSSIEIVEDAPNQIFLSKYCRNSSGTGG